MPSTTWCVCVCVCVNARRKELSFLFQEDEAAIRRITKIESNSIAALAAPCVLLAALGSESAVELCVVVVPVEDEECGAAPAAAVDEEERGAATPVEEDDECGVGGGAPGGVAHVIPV